MKSTNQIGSDLYRSLIEWNKKRGDGWGEIAYTAWHRTPWVTYAYVGTEDRGDNRHHVIHKWCTEKFGPCAIPSHDVPGCWHSGGTSFDGWCYFGFDSEYKLQEFKSAWPRTEIVVASTVQFGKVLDEDLSWAENEYNSNLAPD